MTTAPTLVPRLFQEVVAHAIEALGFLNALPNPVDGGAPLNVPVYPAYPEVLFPGPAVTVAFRPSRHDFDVGENFQDFDDDNQVTKWGVYLPRSVLKCTVYGIGPGECGYIGDCLYSGLISNFALNPTTGEPVEGATIKRLAETAITIIGCDDVTETASNPASPRPYAQFWQMTFPFRCNVEILWQGTAYVPGEIDIAQSLVDPQFGVLATEDFVVLPPS